jgi:peptide deformylase
VAIYAIRQYGDPVLTRPAKEVDEIDGQVARLVEEMFETMYEAPGSGLAANQVGIQRRVFVYDIGDGPGVVINPQIVESSGEWTYDEGCLSVQGLNWPIVRPDRVHLVGYDLEGAELSIEADTLLGRVFQHELDHLDGVLLVDRLDDEQRRAARRILRARALDLPSAETADPPSLSGRAI